MSKHKHPRQSVSSCPRCGLFWLRSANVSDQEAMAVRPDVLVIDSQEAHGGRRLEHKDQALWRVAEDLCSPASRSVLDS